MRGASWAPALGVSLLAGAVVGACAGSTSAPRPSAVEEAVPEGGWASPPGLLRGHDAEDVRDGPALYARYCELCHGPQRQGYAADNAPSLRSPELMALAPDAYLWTAMAYGRPGTPMAAFSSTQGGPLSHDDLHTLFTWLIETSGVERSPVADTPVTGDAARGRVVYAEQCASCHGAEGTGGSAPELANPVLLATASDAFLRSTIATGRSETPMPAFAATLPPADLDAVVAFLRSRSVGWSAPDPVLVHPPSIEHAVLNPDAAPASLEHREERFVSAKSVAAALERGERMVLLDARPVSDWQRSHLPGALPVPFYDGVEAIVPHLPTDGTPIVAYCACPHAASGKVVDALVERGITSARILDEGVLHWATEGYPLELGSAL